MSSNLNPVPAIKRTELSRSPVTGLDHLEIVTQLGEFSPGATSPCHFHHGEETFFVLEGGTVQEVGRPLQERVPGENGVIPRGAHHSGYTVIGDRTIKVLSVYVVDKGKPLQELVSQRPAPAEAAGREPGRVFRLRPSDREVFGARRGARKLEHVRWLGASI